MLKISEAIVVEGKYDKDKLSNIVEGIIVQTNGFSLFKDKEKKKYIAKLAKERGLIILTDSDSAGFLIRNHLKSFIDEKYIKNAYIKQEKGKEKRKTQFSKEGFLGVEGISDAEVLRALERVKPKENSENKIVFTTKDLFNLGLTGSENSKEKKQVFLKKLDLPSYISNKELLKYMNMNEEKVRELLE
ncbi:MAG: DUF4093 domain-containing protein [Clostridia bacterium]